MLKILSCISFANRMTFEEAIYSPTLSDYCIKNGHHLDNFNIHGFIEKSNVEATFIYLYNTIKENNYDLVVIPLTNVKEYNLILDPSKVGDTKIVYIITGDIENVNSVLRYIHNKFYIATTSNGHDKYLKDRKNVIKLFPLINEIVFYRDESVMPEISYEGTDHLIDVSFFGKRTDERVVYLKKLTQDGIDVRAYGDGWSDGIENFEFEGIKTAPRKNLSFQREILTRSKICVVIDEYIKSIHFEALICNALLLTKKSDKSSDYFKPYVIPVFGTPEQLLSQVKKYLNDDAKRSKVRSNLRNHVMANYTYKMFYDRLLDSIK